MQGGKIQFSSLKNANILQSLLSKFLKFLPQIFYTSLMQDPIIKHEKKKSF